MQIWQWAVAVGGAMTMAIAAIFAPAKVKTVVFDTLTRNRWWLIGALVLGLAILFLWYLPRRYPPRASFGDSAVPGQFLPQYWTWMFAFVLGTLAAAYAAIGQIRSAGRAPAVEADPGGFPEIDAAWDEIRARLDQARIDAATQRFYLVLSPSEEDVANLVESAGLQVFSHGPGGPAPIHAFATSDGILLGCGGACRLGAPDDPKSAARLEHLAGRLRALDADCSVVRGVIVLFPMAWCSRPESAREAAAVRDDLRTLHRGLGVTCPTYAIFSGMQTVPGFGEFAARIAAQVSPQMLDQRVGFAIPADHDFSGDLVQRGLTWQSGWFRVWTLNFLAGDPTNHRGNADLYTLDAEFRRYRRRLRSVLESAFSTHKEAEPVFFRGCYFVADGARRDERAFSAGLLRGARSRIIADHTAADWTEEADRADRRYGRAALAVAALGGLPCLAVWLNVANRLPWLGWSGLIAMGVGWTLTGLWLWRR